MHTAVIQPTFDSWRVTARELLEKGIPPAGVLWLDDDIQTPLFGATEPVVEPAPGPPPKVPAAFLEIARSACTHSDPQRWALLYRLLWRLTRG